MSQDVIIVMQARTNSTRLPGKVLLDFLGMPIAVLAAKRAANRGHRLILATSAERSDDALAELAGIHGLRCYRGALDDVLGRFVGALEGYQDDEIVVRLTADNVVPDGELIAEAVADFRRLSLNYLTTSDTASGLPYGCSVEVSRVGIIRQAGIEAKTPFEREHVMPWIRARNGSFVFDKFAGMNRGHTRCTIDCLDDYLQLLHDFPRNHDPVSVSWRDIVHSLRIWGDKCWPERSVDKLVLGTAQFGMPYGIVRANEPDEAESMQLIKIAIASGINWLDTARAYGRSEDVVGKVNATGWSGRCRIVTKLSPMAECSPNAAPELAEAIAENSLRASCMALQRKALDTVLLHRAAHIGMWGGRVFEVLKTWRTKGLLNTIGVSVQTPEELILSIEDVNIEHVQIPFNILDNRWGTAIDKLRPLRDQRRLTVHVRSAFLQGLLLSDDAEAWQCAHVSDATQIRSWLTAQTAATGYEDVAALCLAFLRSHDWIDGVVVGFDNVKQLEQVLMSANQPLLTQQQLDTLTRTRPVLSVKSLDPSQWRSRDRVEK